MFIKNQQLKRATCWIIILAMIWGCANENQPYFKDTNVKLDGADYLSGVVDEFDKYLNGQMSDARVESFWSCVDTAVVSIDRFMVGTGEGGSFKAEDVRWFIGKYFLKSGQPDGVEISDVLLAELMEVKRLFLGGSTKLLSRTEINYTRQIVSEFKLMTLALNPHISVLFNDNKGVVPKEERLATAIGVFSSVLQRFIGLLAKQGATYDINRLIVLIEELQKIIKQKKPNEPALEWKKYVPVFQKAKGLLLVSSENQIEGNEWNNVAKIGSRILEIYFRGKYYLNAQTLYDPKMVGQFDLIFKSVDDILREAIGRRSNQPFTNAEFSSLMFSMSEAGILPGSLGIEDIKRYWWVVVDRMLQPKDTPDDGLGLNELDHLKEVLNNWFEAQRHLLGLETSNAQAKADIIAALNTPWPLRTDAEGKMLFDGLNEPVNIESSTMINWSRLAFSYLVKAYAKDPQNGLTKKEVELAFYDLKPLFVQLGLVEPDNNTFHERVNLESNLFTPRADGNSRIKSEELYEYLNYILAGISAGKKFVEALGTECEIDQDYLNTNCFRVGFRAKFAERFNNMPRMVQFVKKVSDKDWRKFLSNMEVATRDENASNSPIKKGDIYEMAIFMQYIETMMLRFDKDKNDVLDLEETLAAFPHFVNTIAEIADMDPQKDRKELRNIFTFMLKYGEPPDMKNAISILRYLHWRWNQKKWKISAHRGMLVSVLANLSER